MPDVVRLVAWFCAPVMGTVAWLADSAEERQERAHRPEANILSQEFRGRGA